MIALAGMVALAAAAGGRTDRDVWSLAADGRRAAAVVGTCTRSRSYALSPCSARAFSGPFARVQGPPLPGRLTRSCRGRSRNAVEVAAGGGWTAELVERFCPGLGIESAVRRRIEVRGPRARTIPLPRGGALRLAGDRLARADARGGAVLYDLHRGERVLRLGAGKGRIIGHDVQADGTPRLPLAGRTPDVAISAGRVLHVRFGAELVLQRPGGGPRTFARFSPRRERAGPIGLGPRSAVYAVQRYRYPTARDGAPGRREEAGRARVVLTRL